MTDTIIKYDELVQSALIGVVRNLLQDTIKHGLPGDHHFYITLQTNHPDVVIPPYLRERYEDDMTIVMQNQFWDLVVDEDHFEISLSFNRSKEHLYIPFDALLGFFDPSVDFGLHFNSEIDNDSDIEIIEEDEIKDTIAVVEQEDGEEKDNIVTLDAFRKK
ncbi:MAG: ClpXP protease specificity-enhancing factor SspB [Emcibacteraceae bacterium]|nr:ClpXP protease specificity-enhancing factor SspB [Emcibacteraceae bacterium]